MSPRNLSIAIVLGAALAIGIFVAARFSAPTQSQADLHAAFVLPATIELPEFSLVDQRGDPVTRNTFRGRWNLLFFGFTHCPDICPATLQILAAARTELASVHDDPLPRIVFVSVDPERDTPQRLASYVDYFKADILGVTGDVAELRKITSTLGIFFAKQAADGEAYGVDHSAAVIVINPDADFHSLFSAPHNTANYVNDLPIIMADQLGRAPLIANDIVVTRPLPGARMAAAYLSLTNASSQQVLISDVRSPNLESVDMHESVLDDGISRMHNLAEIEILPGRTVRFEPGGKHLMLRYPLDIPDVVTLQFYNDDALLLSVDTTTED